MKKTLLAIVALAAAFMAVSCRSDEESAQQPANKPMVINAVAEGIGAGTRAVMAYKYDIFWSQNDQIYVKNNTNNATFTLKTGQGTTNGTFACESSPFGNGDEVEAFYPKSLVEDDGNLFWPAEQEDPTVVPMYSKKELGGTGTQNFSFASLGAILQIVFTTKQEGVTLKSITLKDGTNPLSGAFIVDPYGKAVMTDNEDAPGITLDLGDGKPVGLVAEYFNIAVPAGTYSNLSITFAATDNSICTLTAKDNVTINHNTVSRLTLTGKEFVATTGTAGAKGADGNVNWIQLWAGGPKFAEYNIGATSATDYGGYYTWGGTYTNGDGITWTDDHNTGTSVLSGNDDTATNLWGEYWRMPKKAELEALIDGKNCDVEWIDGTNKKYNGTTVAGLLCTGKGAYSSNSIFLPAAGYCESGNTSDQGSVGIYWSSTPTNNNETAYTLSISSVDQMVMDVVRSIGYSVRAVLNETEAPDPTKGTAEATINSVTTNVNWIQLWADGPKFAEFNIGATSATDYSGYYTWGGTYTNGVGIEWNGDYNTGTDALTGDNDTATKLWGSNWRMPTQAELEALIDGKNCDVEWTDNYEATGVAGLLCTGKDAYSSNSIFLPAAGSCECGDVSGQNNGCNYWSSTPEDYNAYSLLFTKIGDFEVSGNTRESGCPVRAVLVE